MKFRGISLLLLVYLLASGQTGLAADNASSYDWTGPYVGAHLGYGWGNADTDFSPLPSATDFVSLAPTKLSPNPSGIVGGLQAGYNYQMGSFVAGIEADFSGSGVSGTDTVSPIIRNDGTPLVGTGFLRTHQEISWYGTLRPRLGYTVIPTLLVYGTGGLAYGNVSYSATSDFRPTGDAFFPASFSKTKVGWTAGGGVEYALSRNWTVRTEYLYMDLGSESANASSGFAPTPFQVGYNWKTTAHLINIGVNYKF